MESSEDDAGTATSASRCASAREKDVRLAEDFDASHNFQHESSESRASCGTPPMSEYNFDGDSIPSPSTKDTSTEAILDMIDDFIDGPGAPRRVPLVSEVTVDIACGRITTPTIQSASVSQDSQHNNETEGQKEQIEMPPCEPSLAASANSENVSESVRLQPPEAECIADSEILICANTSTIEESPQASSSVQMNENSCTQQEVISENVEPEVLTEQPVMAPGSSSVETVQKISDASECENLERTVKCVTSSENRDSVTVELAESTSSECSSVSESKAIPVEPSVSRSPLKRRLIRPAPSDRRPDSTVSSTVDSQTTDINTTEKSSSELITKDVSSSSDAVSNVHGSTKLEEISNVREISICKAETSSPSRKIKLVRPKPVMSFTVKTESPTKPATLDKDQCQSTSSDDISTPLSAEVSVETSSSIPTGESVEQESKLVPICDDTSDKQQSAKISELPQEVKINTCDALITKTVEKKHQNIDTPEISLVIKKNDEPSLTVAPSVNQCSGTEKVSADTQSEVKHQSSGCKNQDNILDEEKTVTPSKLSLSLTKASETEVNTNYLESQCSITKPDAPENSSQGEKNTSLLVQTLPLEILSPGTSNCDQDSKQIEQKKVSNSEILKTDTIVPPIKLILTNADHNTADLPSSTQSSKLLEDEYISPKQEDLEKQVPKLTIKLTNKCSKEVKSPVLTMKPLQPPVEENIEEHDDANQQIPSVSKINIEPIPKPIEKGMESLIKPMPPPAKQNVDDHEPTQQFPNVSKINIEPIPKPIEKGLESLIKPMPPPAKQNVDDLEPTQQFPSVSNINIKPTEKGSESLPKSSPPPAEQNVDDHETTQQFPSVSNINIKPTEKGSESLPKSSPPPVEQNVDDHEPTQQFPSVSNINIKPIPKPTEKGSESIPKSSSPPAEKNIDDYEANVSNIHIKPKPKPTEKGSESVSKPLQSPEELNIGDHEANQLTTNVSKIHTKPILKPTEIEHESISKPLPSAEQNIDDNEPSKQIPNVSITNIKPIPKPTEKENSISKPSKLASDLHTDDHVTDQEIPSVTKINIKPILKPTEKGNDDISKPLQSAEKGSESISKPLRPAAQQNMDDPDIKQQIPYVTKINIKPILKPIEKGNDNISKSLQAAERNIDDHETNQEFPSFSKLNIKPIPKPAEKGNESVSTPLRPAAEQNIGGHAINQEFISVSKINIKPITKPAEKGNESLSKSLRPAAEQSMDDTDINQQIPSVSKINIKPIPKPTEKGNESVSKPLRQAAQQNIDDPDIKQQIPTVTKINIKPILKPAEKGNDNISKPLRPATEHNIEDHEINQDFPSVSKINIKPIPKPAEKGNESVSKPLRPAGQQNMDNPDINLQIPSVSKINIKPIPKPTEKEAESILKHVRLTAEQNMDEDNETIQQIPNVTKIYIKPIPKRIEKGIENVSKYLRPTEQNTDDHDNNQQFPSVTKINIKPIPKPTQKVNDSIQGYPDTHRNDLANRNEPIPCITKLNIKPILKPPEKVNEIHRKSSSSEISESEYSENDESTSTSDQASASEQGPLDAVPKVTIRLGKPGTESEGKFYTEKNVPKITIKNIQHSDKDDQDSKLKLIISQSDDKQPEKIPKITIKTVTKSDSQPLSPKLTIKPLKPPENVNEDNEIPKLKISTEAFSSSAEVKESQHVPKITIKPVTKIDADGTAKTPKKLTMMCDSSEHIPVVTKLNIKPILKPTETGESSESFNEKVPVVSKLNIKPVMKPKDNEVDSSIEDVPKIYKLNIKPLKNPEESSSEEKDCDDMIEDIKDSSIPVVTKLNIKPIVKPVEDKALKDSGNQSSETGNSSDDNADHIPIVTKLNIKPIIKPSELEEPTKLVHSEQCIPVVTKLNIKPLIRPEDHSSPSSPKRESLRNIKPLVKPEDRSSPSSPKRESLRNTKPLIKPEDSHSSPSSPKKESLRNLKPEDRSSPSSPKKDFLRSTGSSGIPVLTKLNIKPIVKPEDSHNKAQEDIVEKTSKHPPLVMKINMKNVSDSISENEHLCNNISGKAHSPKMPNSPKVVKRAMTIEGNAEVSSKPTSSSNIEISKYVDCYPDSPSLLQTDCLINTENCESNVAPEKVNETIGSELRSLSKDQTNIKKKSSSGKVSIDETLLKHAVQESIVKSEPLVENKTSKSMNERIAEHHYNAGYNKSQIQNCTLLKKLLSSTKEDFDKSQETKPGNCLSQSEKPETLSNCNDSRAHEGGQSELQRRFSPKPEKTNDLRHSEFINMKMRSIQDVHREANESVTKPLEISVTDKITNQGQDSPRIILKINKTDHGASSKIITEETHKPTDCSPANDSHVSEQTVETVNEIPSPKKHLVNCRRKTAASDSPANLTMGKRLRSSRIVETADKLPAVKRNVNKRPSAIESTSPPQHKESELSILATKRMKLEQLLSANQTLTITPVGSKTKQTSPSKSNIAFNQGGKISHNISLLNNENCSQKNGNSKLHNILSNLQAKQLQTLQLNDATVSGKTEEITTELESTTSTASSDVIVEITRVENCHPEVQEMMINENSVCDLTVSEEVSQDPLEVVSVKPEPPEETKDNIMASIKTIELTPTPRKRGRPRKLPLVETPKQLEPPSPVPTMEERPMRSLRLMRDRPAILKKKPRGGRGRGRGGRRAATPPPDPEPEPEPEPEPVIVVEVVETRPASPIDPTSSRIKLPRMTEALDKSVAGASCATPLTSRRRSSTTDLKLFSSAGLVLDSPVKGDEFMKSPEAAKPRSGRGSRGGRGRTPRNRGRGRGGGRGAMYMKETMGIYGRVCGPATTTVQLFEEETCMMDDNATPSKPSHLLDEDSQSSVKSSTNDSNKMKKSKFADLFDSNKVWTAADVKEYTWPPPETPNAEPQVMMIQEQVAMFLGVKSFKRRYPELKRRPVGGEEREYVLSKEVVSEALCDLGITAVEASEVLDIMLSDYPHKYEEYRSHQREKQIASSLQKTVESKAEDRSKVEIKLEKPVEKPEPPKVDPEKTRQDMAAAAIASASEWNARANAWRRPACVDLQSMTVHRRRAPPAPPPVRVRPPAGFYPHALLPGQYQHWYRAYTSEQLRYFPLNTVLAAPPAPPSPAESSSESEASWGEHSSSSDDTDTPHHHSAKRKKLSRVKRSSQQDKDKDKEKEEKEEAEVETCRICKLRLEANRKHAHERFLVCAHCNAKLHPVCVDLPADTIRKCREYAWQCAECKSCCACRQPQDDDKMLFCDRCDRGFHIYCVGLSAVPSGRWHCVECAVCKSCGARDPNGLTPGAPGTPGPSTPGPSTPGAPAGPVEWQHQTRRGPGGHKVYSHSLCMPCARAYRIGRYCPLCERSFIGPKGTMQLVICKLCDRQLHQECVRQSSAAALRVLDYTCADCRRGGITSRAAAVRVAPRTIATLFMAKRRFNKYAHRQYMASRLQALQDAEEPERADTDVDDTSDPLDGAGDPPPPPLPDDSADASTGE